jgi:hypothetical protein
LDCRTVAEAPPSYLIYHDGLHSGQIKRYYTTQRQQQNQQQPSSLLEQEYNNNLQHYSRRYVAERRVFPALLEAQNEGRHGYSNPVRITINIGSELGRHRSVLVTEWTAQHLRSLLRKNNQGLVHQPVSVGTVHRDVDRKVPPTTMKKKTGRRDEYDDDDNDKV